MGMDDRMRKESCTAVLDIYRRLRTKPYGNPYQTIGEFLTDERLKEVGGSLTGEEVLLWASHKLSHKGRYLFWEGILRNRHCFRDTFIAAIWHELLADCGNENHQFLEEADGTTSYFGRRETDAERLRNSVITSPLMIDSRTVLHRYCQVQKRGWETLRYLGAGRQWRTLPSWASVRSNIQADDVPGFEMGRVMLGSTLSFCIVAELLACGAWSIFRHLLENAQEELEAAVPLEELACHVTAQFPDQRSIPALELLEEARPGIVGQFRDALGQNLLWYGMHNPRTCWFHPDCKLTAFLLEKECNPDAPTNIGLSCKALTDSLTNEKKASIWRKKIMVNKQLEEVQPNIWSKRIRSEGVF